MRSTTIAAVLLVLATPAFAVDRAAILKFEDLNGQCVYGKGEAKTCAAAEKLGKKLKAGGYCIYGHGVVGRASRDGKHCYTISIKRP